MSVNRSLLNWGIFLVVLGAVPLAVEWNVIDGGLARELVRLWPLLLIGIGLGLLLRYTPAAALGGVVVAATLGLLIGSALAGGWSGAPFGGCLGDQRATGTTLARDGTFAARGAVSMELTCAELSVDSQPGSGWRVVTVSPYDRAPAVEVVGDSLRLRSTAADNFPAGPRRDWQVTLPEAVPLSLEVTVNATDGALDLAGSTVERLGATLNGSNLRLDVAEADMSGASVGLTLNAASATLLLPAGGVGGSGTVTLNASSLTICVDPLVGLSIEASETLSSNNFAAAGLSLSASRWTVGPADGPHFNLAYSGNVSSIKLDRSGGCP
jgi:hypothetical protein